MLLIPNSHLHDVFEEDSSGLRLTVSTPDYKTIHIIAVLPGSPAAGGGAARRRRNHRYQRKARNAALAGRRGSEETRHVTCIVDPARKQKHPHDASPSASGVNSDYTATAQQNVPECHYVIQDSIERLCLSQHPRNPSVIAGGSYSEVAILRTCLLSAERRSPLEFL